MIGNMLLQAAVDLNQLALYGVGLLIIMAILFGAGQVMLSFLAQRNLNDLHALGMQAIVANNDIETVDSSLDDGNGNSGNGGQ